MTKHEKTAEGEGVKFTDLLDCPNAGCGNQGWYADYNPRTGEAEQVQCEFCYCEPRSKFNAAQYNLCLIAPCGGNNLETEK